MTKKIKVKEEEEDFYCDGCGSFIKDEIPLPLYLPLHDKNGIIQKGLKSCKACNAVSR